MQQACFVEPSDFYLANNLYGVPFEATSEASKQQFVVAPLLLDKF